MNDDGVRVLLTNDGSRTLYSDDAGECFHSESGAWSEAKTVFLENSGVAAALSDGQNVHVLEIGFGTGLNFLLSADAALQDQCSLHYVGLDVALISANTFGELGYGTFLKSADLKSKFPKRLLSADGEDMNLHVQDVWLQVILQDAVSWVSDAKSIAKYKDSFDAIYLDAFSPESCPQLWSEPFFSGLLVLLQPAGAMVNYCSKSVIQKRLRSVGFEVGAVSGPAGGKRQVLKAAKQNN